jgi:hypothetical protein
MVGDDLECLAELLATEANDGVAQLGLARFGVEPLAHIRS